MSDTIPENIVPRLIKPKDAAGYLAVSERTLWKLSQNNTIPVVRMGRAVRYDRQDLDGFIQRAKTGGGNGQ
ncbi:MAG: helix-turn-helix domain-containing protein [Deltaproteobacteria bacterium]|nr:helix-turn-helix domain-containing protein [Deltaproteobacteria bacterium]